MRHKQVPQVAPSSRLPPDSLLYLVGASWKHLLLPKHDLQVVAGACNVGQEGGREVRVAVQPFQAARPEGALQMRHGRRGSACPARMRQPAWRLSPNERVAASPAPHLQRAKHRERRAGGAAVRPLECALPCNAPPRTAVSCMWGGCVRGRGTRGVMGVGLAPGCRRERCTGKATAHDEIIVWPSSVHRRPRAPMQH